MIKSIEDIQELYVMDKQIPLLFGPDADAAMKCLRDSGCAMVAGAIIAGQEITVGEVIRMANISHALKPNGFAGPFSDGGTYRPDGVGIWQPKQA